MITIKEILEYCRANLGSNVCVFPFEDENGDIKRLRVENPFFTEEEGIRAFGSAVDRLREAPKELQEMRDRLLGMKK